MATGRHAGFVQIMRFWKQCRKKLNVAAILPAGKRAMLSAAGIALALMARPARCADITLCADVWCPYNCAPNSSRPGISVEIAREIFGKAGYHVDYQEVGWARCIEDTREGRYSGIIAAMRTDAPDFTFPAIPIGITGDAYAVRRGDTFNFDGGRGLDGKVLGVVRSYTFSGAIGAYIAAHATDTSRIEFVSGNGALMKNLAKLITGHVDVVLDDKNVMRNAIDELGLSDRLTVSDGPNATPVYIAFSPKAPKGLAHIMDDGMAGLRASGRLAEIMARYNVKNMP